MVTAGEKQNKLADERRPCTGGKRRPSRFVGRRLIDGFVAARQPAVLAVVTSTLAS